MFLKRVFAVFILDDLRLQHFVIIREIHIALEAPRFLPSVKIHSNNKR